MVKKVSGYAVHRTMDVLAAEHVLALNFGRDLGAGNTDVVDDRIATVKEELRDARRIVVKELKEPARQARQCN